MFSLVDCCLLPSIAHMPVSCSVFSTSSISVLLDLLCFYLPYFRTKTKRQRHITSESVQKKPVNQCEQVRTPEKKGKHENETRPEVGIKGTKNIKLMSGSKE